MRYLITDKITQFNKKHSAVKLGKYLRVFLSFNTRKKYSKKTTAK